METPDRPDFPEVKAFTGHLTFKAPVGDALCEVRASVVEDEIDWDTAEVLFDNTDIVTTLVDAQQQRIQQELDENRWEILFSSGALI